MTRIGRIPVVNVAPLVEGGARPVTSVVDEEFAVTATVFREGHDAVGATVVLTSPDGRAEQRAMVRVNAGLDAWAVTVSADHPGRWSYRVEGWSDPYGTWHHDAVIKVGAGVDVELMLEEGARVLERCAAEVDRTAGQRAPLLAPIAGLRDTEAAPEERLGAGVSAAVRHELGERPTWARSPTSTRSSRRPGSCTWRWRSTWPSTARRTTRGSAPSRNGSPPAPTAPSRTRRTRRRSTRTSTR